MNDIAKEYGTALFTLACENGSEDDYLTAIKAIRTAFDNNPDFKALLSSPAISQNQKSAVIEEVFGEALPEHTVSFLQLLCEKGRMKEFDEAVDEYVTLYNLSKRIARATVTSAVELTDTEKEKLIKRLEEVYSCRINPEYTVDADLIGGVRVELDGKIIDGSLRHYLREAKEVMNL